VSRLLSDLHPSARPAFNDFLARCIEAQIPVLITCTGRTPEEQGALWAIGRTDGQSASKIVTWTLDSRHVMSPRQGMKSLAIDVVPYEIYTSAPGGDKLDWNNQDPQWDKLGATGEACGLKWGVVIGGVRKDKGHFEFIGPIV
jgi:peptidoglycan L-alanyl-D-glutamate endopeptidase CwlK